MNTPSAGSPRDPAALDQTALAVVTQRVRLRIWRTLGYVMIMCASIALLVWVFNHGSIVASLVYSFTIGLFCTLLFELMRLGYAGVHDIARSVKHLPRSGAGFSSGWRGIWPAVAVSAAIGPPIGLTIGDQITGYQSPSLLNLNAFNTQLTLALTLIATLVSVAVLSSMERMSSARAQAEAAQRQASESQLRLLQSQLEPHMLFNTLANLRVLISLDPARAQAMLDRLIAYLRATLGASRVAQHPLAAEYERLGDYLALMAVRMGPRLQVRLELAPELGALPVPPLLLQPLVENSIQHGLEPKVEGGRIEVNSRRAGASLVITVRDTGVGLAAAGASAATPAGSGFGLAQVRERLATLYGERASFSLAAADDAEGGTLATLTLPVE